MTCLLIVIAVIVLLFTIAVLREFWLHTKVDYKIHKQFPAPKTTLFFGSLWGFLLLNNEQLFRTVRFFANTFKTSYSIWWNGYLLINVINGRDAEYILASSKCLDKGIFYEYLQPFMGTGLITSGGKKWLHRRKILTPAFHFNILQQQFHSVFKNETDQLVELIRNDPNKLIHLQDYMSRFTLNNVCETAMGVKLASSDESNKYRHHINMVSEMMVYRIMRPWLHSNLLCMLTGYSRKFTKLVGPLHNFTREIIKKRRHLFQSNQIHVEFDNSENIYETKKSRYAMLDTLLDAEAQGFQINNEDIREEVDTFMIAGHDTTAAALTFTLFLLAENPHIQQKLYEEILDFAEALNINEATMNDLNQLKYLDRVLKESFRIFPPVPYISRIVSEEVLFKDVVLPVNTIVQIHIMDIHRDEDQFPDPEKFDPDRFLPEATEKRHPYAYVPFSAGQRNCIGQKFALLEIKTLLVKLILNFHLEQVTKRDEFVFITNFVLAVNHPITVKFNLRK